MARVKSKSAIKHRKVRALARGYHAARRKRFGAAHEAVMHAGAYAFHGRKLRKRDMRSLWIIRISAAAKQLGTSYSKLMAGLKEEKIELDRKVLSEIAAKHMSVFEKIVAEVKAIK